MKSVRVKLMRQMKEESERFRTLKKEKEKEIMQLKQQVSSPACYVSVKRGHVKIMYLPFESLSHSVIIFYTFSSGPQATVSIQQTAKHSSKTASGFEEKDGRGKKLQSAT